MPTQEVEYMLMEVLDDGERLLLTHDPGIESTWWIEPVDMPTVCTWIPTSPIRARLVDPAALCPFELTHLGIDVTVRARKEHDGPPSVLEDEEDE